jgi:integrase
MAAYERAKGGGRLEVGAARTRPGTVAATITGYFGSLDFANLAESTRITRRRILERFRAEHGDKGIASLERRHIVTMMDAKAKTPGSALNFLTALRAILRYAVAIGLRDNDPTVGIRNPKLRIGGFYTWSEQDIAAFEIAHPIGTRARLAFALLLYTAQRRADVITLGWQHVRDGRVHLRQRKTGRPLAIPVHPELKAVLGATPTENLTFLVTKNGGPFEADAFSHWFKHKCQEAGLPARASAHGLRKAACRRLAEAGCSVKVIAAISGHASLREVARYTDAAEQASLAEQGIEAVTRTRSGKPG